MKITLSSPGLHQLMWLYRVEVRSSVLRFCLDMLGFGYDNLDIRGADSLNGCHY